MDSYRLAPLGTYTERRDIPIYRMMGNRNGDGQLSMMYAVVLQNAAEEERILEQERRLNNRNDIEDEEDDEENEEENIEVQQSDANPVANIEEPIESSNNDPIEPASPNL